MRADQPDLPRPRASCGKIAMTTNIFTSPPPPPPRECGMQHVYTSHALPIICPTESVCRVYANVSRVQLLPPSIVAVSAGADL